LLIVILIGLWTCGKSRRRADWPTVRGWPGQGQTGGGGACGQQNPQAWPAKHRLSRRHAAATLAQVQLSFPGLWM